MAVLPFVWLMGLVAAYELAFMRVDLASSEKQARRRAKAAIALEAKLSLSAVRSFDGPGTPPVVEAATLDEGRRSARSRIAEARPEHPA